jgi:hypothetical protein
MKNNSKQLNILSISCLKFHYVHLTRLPQSILILLLLEVQIGDNRKKHLSVRANVNEKLSR